MQRRLSIGLAIIFGLFLIWRIVDVVFLSNTSKTQRSGPPAVAVEIDSVHYGYLSETRQLTGTVQPQYKYIIAPKISGRVVQISKRIGDWVRDGEVVAKIDDAEYQQNVIEAEANLNIGLATLTEAKNQLDLGRQDLNRVQSLQAKGISSTAELDAATSNFTTQKSRYQLAQAQVDQRQAALKSAKIRLGYTILTASKPGFVGERFVDEGALLAPNSAVVSVVGIDSVIVSTTIIERDYGYVKVGQPAQVMVDAFAKHPFKGFVSRIAPMLQEASRVAQMEVEVNNDSLFLKPGMFARVDVRTAERPNARYVASRALVRKEGASGLFMVDPDEKIAHYIPVKVGILTPEYTEVENELPAGMVVVTLGQHLLDEGSPVILPQQENSEQGQAK